MTIIERLARNQNYQFWVFQVTFWFFWASFYPIFQYYVPVILTDALVALLLTTGLRYAYQAVMEKHLLLRILSILLGSAIVGLLWNIFKRQLELSTGGDEILQLYEDLGIVGYYTHQYVGLSFWIILAWSGLYFGLALYHLLQEERATSLSAQAMAHEAQRRGWCPLKAPRTALLFRGGVNPTQQRVSRQQLGDSSDIPQLRRNPHGQRIVFTANKPPGARVHGDGNGEIYP